jgi:phage-related protein (TIGR01555 family)
MRMVDMTRSSSRSVLLDADGEDFSRAATSFAGIPDMLDRFMMLLSAATGIPVSILMGRAPQGMNATGDADVRMFYDKISAVQDNEITPVLEQIFGLLGLDVPEDLEVEWHPLWEPSDKEKADTELVEQQTEKAKADTYAVYVTMGAVFPEQVAIAEFGSGEGVIEIDEAMLEKSLDNTVELAMNPPDPVAPVVPGANPNAPPAADAPAF